MLGKLIDRLALTALVAALLYLLLLRLGLPIPLCCLLAFVLIALAESALLKRPRHDRATPAQARSALWRIATLPESEARAALQALTGREDLLPVLKHPDAHLDAGAVFDLWRAHQGDSLCAVATCPADAEAFRAARALGMTLIDASALIKTIRRTGRFVPPDALRRVRGDVLRCCAALLDGPARPRAALYGVSLLAMYRLTGLPLYLVFGLFTLGVVGAKWVRATS